MILVSYFRNMCLSMCKLTKAGPVKLLNLRTFGIESLV